MKIRELIIENFRIFNGVKKFDFANRDFIVISGPNGNGKSTIFDSIQWCLTGKIPRYDGSNERKRFNFLMNEAVYNRPSQSLMKVEVVLISDGVLYRISRSQKKYSDGSMGTPKIKVNGQTYGVTVGEETIRNILAHSELEETKGNSQEKAMNLATFFSSTQLLSQDALNDFIRGDKPGERYKLIDKILGVKKYGSDFEAFMSFTKETLVEEIARLNQVKQGPFLRLGTLNVLRNQKQHDLSNIGEIMESELIERTKELLDECESVGISVPDSILTVEQINNQFLQTLVTLRKSINDRRDRYQGVKVRMQGAKEVLAITPEIYSIQKQSILSKQERLNNKIERRMRGRNVMNDRKANLEALKVRRRSFQEASDRIIQLQVRRTELEKADAQIFSHPMIVDVMIKFSKVDVFAEGYRKRQNEQVGIEACIKFHELKNDVGQLEKTIANQSDILKFKQLLIFQEEQNHQKITQELSEKEQTSETQKNSMIEQMIRQVQMHVLVNELEQSCPVCGEKYQSPEMLHDSIKKQIDEFDKGLSELQQQILDYSTQKNVLGERLKQMREEVAVLLNIYLLNRTKLEQLVLEREKIKTAVPDYLLEISLPDVLQKKVVNDEFLIDYKTAYGLLESLDQNKQTKEQLQIEEGLLLQSLDILKQESKRWAAYLERDEIEIDRILQGINRYLTKVAEEYTRNDQEKSDLLLQLSELEEKWKQREMLIEVIGMDLPGFRGTSEELDSWNLQIEKLLNKMDKYEHQLGVHLAKIQTFLSKDQVTGLQNEITSLRNQVEAYDAQIRKYEEFISTDLECLKARHISVQSELIGDYLLQHSDFIDQLFMQISPHAFYRHVQLVPKDKNLYIVMTRNSAKDDDLRQLSEEELKKKFNASLTFSSAQSNVLAVCIFLALNLSQKWTRLQLLGIDDPFQNLDDINAFSFVDVLSQIVSKQKKQVLISTHSEDFAHLMKMKMGASPERIGTIVFQAYSDQGVSVGGNCLVPLA